MRAITVTSKIRFALFVALAVVFACLTLQYGPNFAASQAAVKPAPTAKHGPATIVLQDGYKLPMMFETNRPEMAVRPTTLATADFDVDGYPDIVSGYATGDRGYLVVQRGNPEAFAPTLPENVEAISESRFPVAFLPTVKVIELASAPDFIVVGDFDRDSNPDVITASLGDNALHFAAGDGKGGFAAERTIAMPGRVTALTSGQIDQPDNLADLVVGVDGDNGASLLVYEAANGLADAPVAYDLPAPAQSLALGQVDDSPYMDVAILAGGNVMFLHGRNQTGGGKSARQSAARLETIALPFAVRALALGEFIYDRAGRTELALLRDDGVVTFMARGELDTRPFTIAEVRERRYRMHLPAGDKDRLFTPQKDWRPDAAQVWHETEDLPVMASVAANTAASATVPVMFGARLSGQSVDDLVVLDAATQQLKVYAVEAPEKVDGEVVSFAGPRTLMSLPTPAAPLAALSMRVSLFSRPGLVFLTAGGDTPEIMPSAPTATFIVDRTDDVAVSACTAAVNDCSMRGAITAANSLAGADIITIPSGTYTLTLAGSDDTNAGGDLDVNGEATFNGTAAATTIIQAGTTNLNGIDKVIGYNPVCTTALNGSVNNVTIKFGRNLDTVNANFSQTGGGLDYCSPGTSSLSITNSTFDNNTVSFAYGGGINFDSLAGTQTISMTGVTISNNKTVNTPGSGSGAGGGGLNFFDGGVGNLTLTNCIISGNSAQTSGSGDGQGGGIYIRPQGGGSTMIHGTTISGNTAKSSGGGIAILPTVTAHNVTIDQSSVISGNTSSGTGVGNNAEGGGVYYNIIGGGTVAITKTNITGNTANTAPTGNNRGGGGIAAGTGALTLSFSRIVNNVATTGTGLRRDTNAGAVTATNNWWGCSTGPTAAPCDTAIFVAGGAGSLTTAPFLRLTNTAASTSLVIGQTTTLTASFLTDSAGGAVAASNLNVLVGLPITFNNPLLGTLSGAQTTIQASGTATATFTAATVGAAGKGDAIVDNGTTSTSPTITVGKASTTTGLGSSSNPSTFNQSVTFTATITVTAPGTGSTSGTVTFNDGGVNIVTCASQTVGANVATCVISTLVIGSHSITATYNGDANFNSSPASNSVTQVVNATTASSVSVSGRVVNPGGYGLPRARMTMADGNGNAVIAVTNPFGYYSFVDIQSDRTYIVSVTDKRYRFAPQIVVLTDNLTGLDFAPVP